MTFTSSMVYLEVTCLYFTQCLVFGITCDTMPFYYHRCKVLRVVALEFLGSAFFIQSMPWVTLVPWHAGWGRGKKGSMRGRKEFCDVKFWETSFLLSPSWRFTIRISIYTLNLSNLLNLGYHKPIWACKTLYPLAQYLLISSSTWKLRNWYSISKMSLQYHAKSKPIQAIWKPRKNGLWLPVLWSFLDGWSNMDFQRI